MQIDWTKLMMYIRYASLGLNVIILYKWLESKLKQSKFLSGRWEGTLICTYRESGLDTGISLDCTLVITDHKSTEDQAILYYETIRPSPFANVRKGLDELINYDSDLWFFINRRWQPTFRRAIHEDTRHEPYINLPDKVYDWQCDICRYWSKEKMNVTIIGEDIHFKGALKKI